MTLFRLLLASILVAGVVPNAAAQKCDALSDTAKRALGVWIDSRYGSKDGVDCGLGLGYAVRDLTAERAAAIPCLLEIYEHGLTRSRGLWQRTDQPAPKDGRWALMVLRDLDPPTALRLYRAEVGKSAPGSDARVRIELEIAKLGGDETLRGLAGVLAQTTAADSPSRRALMLEIASVLADRDYLAGAAAVRHLMSLVPASNTVVPVYAAQLGRDTDQLQRLARTSGAASAAVHALLRIGRRDLVEQLAADPKNAFANVAKESLQSTAQKP